MADGATAASGMPERRPFAVPAVLVGQGITLRRQTEEDVPFLCRLYVSLRWEEVQRVPQWNDEIRLAFLEDQYSKQHHHYTTHYTRSDFFIVERNGEPVGRLLLDRGHHSDLRVVDIAFLPEARGKSFGTAFLTAVQEEALAEGKKVSIHVEQENPAKRLYARLGFRDISQTGPYWLMEWAPA
ncbi:GNAT family N-acetyltransferase [Azospirillum sp. TSO22-1]|uniref:GNAT family N-acetyltransferase n=1 Tax=Azospirillum sp. TSO22-1 TaxID=716789 RepID=UPI000D641FD2|nr:GNAT family N-acetyltransferase [Azospirillum sp. TSO22-1]